jgi:hypothetical protein
MGLGMGKCIWGLVFWAIFSNSLSPGHPAFDHAPIASTAKITEWLNDSANPSKTVESFLSRFPERYREHFVLQYESRSLHLATPSAPRMIFYGPDSRLLTAISGEPSDPRYNIVELIEFSPVTSSFQPYEIDFSDSHPKLNSRLTSCRKCHGTDLKPNFDPYDLWPGTYGTLHDTIPYKTFENESFASFLNIFKGIERYRALPERFHLTQETLGGDPTYFTTSRGVGLSGTFSLLLGFLNRERITRQIIQSENHLRYRNAIVSALIGCDTPIEKYIPADLLSDHTESFSSVLEDTRDRLQSEKNDRIERARQNLKLKDAERLNEGIDNYGLRDDEILRTARLRYLLEKRKTKPLALDEWSLTLRRGTYNFNDGVSGLQNLIGHYCSLAFKGEVAPCKESYQEIPYPVTSYSKGDDFRLVLYELAPSKIKSVCGKLDSPKRSEVSPMETPYK